MLFLDMDIAAVTVFSALLVIFNLVLAEVWIV